MNRIRKEKGSGINTRVQTWLLGKGKGKKGVEKNSQQGSTPPRCKYGNNCWNLQWGACNYAPPRKEVKCGHCGAIGHIEFECNKFKKVKEMAKDIPRYNPVVNPNAKTPNPHALMIQYIDGEPYQLTTNWTALKSQSGNGSKSKSALLTLKNKQKQLKELKLKCRGRF